MRVRIDDNFVCLLPKHTEKLIKLNRTVGRPFSAFCLKNTIGTIYIYFFKYFYVLSSQLGLKSFILNPSVLGIFYVDNIEKI